MKEWVQQPSYDPNQTSELLARQLAHLAGKLDVISKLENIIRLQEKANGQNPS
jgi:hypothetical protein